MPSNSPIRVKVLRQERAKEGFWQEYLIDSGEPLSVMALLSKIHDGDPGFACRTSTCFKGLCGSCLVRLNGKDVLGCTTLVQPGESVTLEPHSGFETIRDLVVDFSTPKANGGQHNGKAQD